MIVTKEEAAAFLSVPAADVERITAAIDADVKRYCGRSFERKAIVEYSRGYNSDVIFLRESPIEVITEVRVDASGLLGADTIVTDLTAFVVEDQRLYYRGSFFPEGPRVARVTYTAGYWPATATDPTQVPKMPEDLRDAVLQLIAERHRQGVGERLKSESIGAYSFTRFDGDMNPAVKRVLRSYKRL